MRALISGSTGLIGRALVAELWNRGYSVSRLIRPSTRPWPRKFPQGTAIQWFPSDQQLEARSIEGFDIIIHLAGEPIADGKWTDEKKQRIYESRIGGTTLLCEKIAQLRHKPQLLISASAVGVYGTRGDEQLTEQAMVGGGFLADTARQWEKATHAAAEAGIRVVNLRLGMVLSRLGGALTKMLPAFKFGLGGKFGSGDQYVSWIALTDVLRAIDHIIDRPELTGPVNAVAPQPVTNAEFAAELAQAVDRLQFMVVPEWALRMVLGEMADEVLLASQRVIPEKLQQTGFEFQYPTLDRALAAEI